MTQLCGAIDLGGTKIEARLYDGEMHVLETRRIPTPVEVFSDFLNALSVQIEWLEDRSSSSDLPVGICIPGIINAQTGVCFASNVPVSGHNLGAALEQRFGRRFPILNDCMALAYSEVHGGAADAFHAVVGLVLGTGVGAGFCEGGEIPKRLSGMVLEIGHTGMPARILQKYGLPLWPCGCGATGCMERYMAGSALTRLSEWKLGQSLSGADLVAMMQGGDAGAQEVFDIWIDLAAECLLTLQLTVDPDCIVLGGGASLIPGLPDTLSKALSDRQLGTLTQPEIRVAQHGDASGARGMALLASDEFKRQRTK